MSTHQSLGEAALEVFEAFEHLSVPMGVYDVDSLEVISMNSAGAELYGYTREEMEHFHMPDLVAPIDRPGESQFALFSTRTHRTRTAFVQHVTKTGRILKVEVNSIPFDMAGRRLRLVLMRDITDLEGLMQQQNLFASAQQVIDEAIWDWDLETDALTWGPQAASILGHPSETIEPTIRWWENQVAAKDLSRILRGRRAAIEGGADNWQDEYGFVTASGREMIVQDRAVFRRNADGVPVQMIGAVVDITRRKQIEAEREEFFRISRELIVCTDLLGQIVSANQSARRLIGYAEPDIQGRFLLEFVTPKDRVLLSAEWEKVAGGNSINDFVARIITSEDQQRDVQWNITPNLVLGRCYAVGRDVTEARRRGAVRRMLEAAIETTEDMVIATDARFREPAVCPIVFANRAAETITGFTREEMIGSRVRLLTDNWLDTESKLVARQRLLAGEHTQHQIEARKKDGRAYWAELQIYPLLEPGGQASHYICVARDITERRAADERLARSEDQLKTAQHLAHVGSWSYEIATGTILGSDEFHRLVGHEGESRISERGFYFPLIPEGERDTVLQHFRRTAEFGESQAFEHRLVTPDGTKRDVLVRTQAVVDDNGKPTHVLGSLQDVTELRAAHRELEQALAESKELAVKAQAANKLQSAFLQNMSHEIRTPLNGVIGLAQMLQMSNLDQDDRELVDSIVQSGQSLFTILNEILDYSRMEAGNVCLQSEPFDICDTVRCATELFRGIAHRKGLNLRFTVVADCPVLLIGDAQRLRQVVSNLVGNAVKFTTDGSVDVELRAVRHKIRSDVTITITDTGPGIPPDSLERIFERFYQVDMSHSRSHGGTGLGLAIVQRLVELMGGTVSVVSVQGEGAQFTVKLSLPIAKSTEE